jgi:hypothetical protein
MTKPDQPAPTGIFQTSFGGCADQSRARRTPGTCPSRVAPRYCGKLTRLVSATGAGGADSAAGGVAGAAAGTLVSGNAVVAPGVSWAAGGAAPGGAMGAGAVSAAGTGSGCDGATPGNIGSVVSALGANRYSSTGMKSPVTPLMRKNTGVATAAARSANPRGRATFREGPLMRSRAMMANTPSAMKIGTDVSIFD